MVELDDPAAFIDLAGHELGVSDWLTIDQQRVDDFARVTGDDFWIHVDVARAQAELPGGRTIVHGLLLLGLVPLLQRQIFRVRRRGVGLNYGSDRVRYTASVMTGSRVRLRQSVGAAVRTPVGTRLTTDCTIEVEGLTRPGVVAQFILLLHDA